MNRNNVKVSGYILQLLLFCLIFSTNISAQIVPPPDLVSPADGSVNLSTPITLVWDHPSAISYQLQVATNSSFNNLVIDVSGITDTYYELNSLSTGTTYYWRVNATNILLLTSDWSAVWDFTTAQGQTIPNAPNLVNPSDGATNESINPVLEWDAVSNAEFYDLQVAEDGSFNNIVFENSDITGTLQQIGPLNNSTQYFWRVNARNQAGVSSWSAVWNFTTEAGQTVPSTPILLSPSNGSTDTSLNPVLVWQEISNANYYRLQVAEDGFFNNKIFDDSLITSNSKQVGPLTAGAQYFWRVNARNQVGVSSWSTVWNFTTSVAQTAPSTPNLVSPANGATDVVLNPVLSWESISNAEHYRLQVAKDGSFNNKIFDDSTLVSASHQISSLEDGTQYFWRVNAKNSAGTSNWSSAWTFTTLIVQTIPTAPELVSPANNATDESLHPILIWNGVSGADIYGLQVATDSLFNNKFYDDSTIYQNYMQVGELSFGQQYFWRVKASNDAGSSNWSTAWRFTTSEDENFAPQLISPLDGARNLPLTLICSWNSVAGAQKYHLIVSSQPDFSSIFLSDSTTALSIQLENLSSYTTYFWKVRSNVNNTWQQYCAPWKFTTRSSSPTFVNIDTTISFPNHDNLSQYKSTDYKIIGIPGSSQLSITNFLPGSFNMDWMAYWDNGAPEDYLNEFNENSFFFSVGKAFWIIKKGPMQITATVESPPLNSRANVEIPLHPGWNLITNPLDFPIVWDSVKTLNGISEPIYSFEGAYDISTMLLPMKGFYYFNTNNHLLIEIPSGTPGNAPARGNIFSKFTGNTGWIVNIKMKSEEYTDSIAWFGVSSEMTDNSDNINFHKPRNWGSSPTIYFLHPEWDENYPVFASDIKPLFDESEEWLFEINSTPWKEVSLTFNLSEFPANFDLYLYNSISKQWINIKENSSLKLTPYSETTSFKLMAGKNIQDKLNNTTPTYFNLGNNFPNPFNPSTTFSVTILQKSNVEIAIFNVLGDRIKTLYNGSLDTGEHWFKWDGSNDKGISTSSGIYFYRISTNKFVDVKKMILIK